MQIAPKNLFRYHGDGAQWNAGIGEIAYKKLGWRKAAIIMDDYSFGWTSGAGMIADFCAVGGKITKRVFPPLNTTDYAPFVRQLPPPNQVDGYFSAVGGTGTAATAEGVRAGVRQARPEEVDRQPVLRLPRCRQGRRPEARRRVRRRLRQRARASKTPAGEGVPARASKKCTRSCTAGRRLRLQLLQRRLGAGPGPGRSPVARSARSSRRRCRGRSRRAPFQVSNGGSCTLDSRRQAIQDQYQLQLVKNADGSVGPQVVAYVPERRPVVRRPVQADRARRPAARSPRARR